jgi:gas vesicle protein
MTQNQWTEKFTTFAVGVGVGALLALLFAPASGEQTREYLANTVNRGLTGAASAGKRWTRQAQESLGNVKSSVAGAVRAGERAYRAAKDA